MQNKKTNDSMLPSLNTSVQFSLPFFRYGEFTASAMLSDEN